MKTFILRYLKMLIPVYGTFTNGDYYIDGVMWLGRINGLCIATKYRCVINYGEFVNWPQYHLRKDLKPQFYKI